LRIVEGYVFYPSTHTRKHERRKGGIEPRSKAHSLWRTVRPNRADRPRWAARTVRQGTADCPHPCRGLSSLSRGPSLKSNRTSSCTPRTTDRPRGARGLSARHPRTVRPTHADRPKLRPTKTQNHDGSKRKASKNSKNTRRTRAARTVRVERTEQKNARPRRSTPSNHHRISQAVEAVETRVWGLEKRYTRML
jgi:hypothetical protein